MSNKKGQEGASGTTIVGLLLLLVLLALIIWLIFFGGFGAIKQILGLQGATPLDNAITSCNAVAAGGFDAFCAEIKSVNIEGNLQYVTCGYLREKLERVENDIDCSSFATESDVYFRQFKGNCEKLKKSNFILNGLPLQNSSSCKGFKDSFYSVKA